VAPKLKGRQCYSCNKWINEKEAQIIKKLYDKIMDEGDMDFTEKLVEDYVHCTGPKQQFFKDGGIVLCGECVARDILEAIAKVY